MPSTVKSVPNPSAPLTPYLAIAGAADALAFYKKAFGATERMRMDMPGGRIGHAEIEVAGATIMLADEFPEMGFKGPKGLGGSGVALHLYVEDVDAFVRRAEAAGAKIVRPVEDQFYGDRTGQIEDPFGHRWMIATHKEDLSEAEIKGRAAKLFGGG